MQKENILSAVQQSWIHSHEEDTDTEMVYRPAGFDFPLSRGRTGFELKPGHKLVELHIAPTDTQEEATGSWDLKMDANDLVLQLNPSTSSARSLHIKSVDENLLVVEKE